MEQELYNVFTSGTRVGHSLYSKWFGPVYSNETIFIPSERTSYSHPLHHVSQA